MPYDASGKAITQEQKYKREKWEAQHEKLTGACTTAAFILLGILLVSGFIAIICGIVSLWMSGEFWMQCLSAGAGILFGMLFVMSLLFARFEI